MPPHRVPDGADRDAAIAADQHHGIGDRRELEVDERLHRAVQCGGDVGDVLRGVTDPAECPLFGRRCRPETPVGACMVSGEGACAAAYQYGVHS